MKKTDELKIEIFHSLHAGAEDLFAFTYQQYQRATQEGWQCFFRREYWLEQNVPGPAINEAGIAHSVRLLRQKLREQADPHLPGERLRPLLEPGQTYRNHFAPGLLDVDVWDCASDPWDLVINQTVNDLMVTQDRHMVFELDQLLTEWFLQASEHCTMTPPFHLYSYDKVTPVRDPHSTLALDGLYWRARYPHEQQVMNNDAVCHGADWPKKIMVALAADFEFDAAMSSARRLLFLQKGRDELVWAIMLEKGDGHPEFTYPPSLLLLATRSKAKLKQTNVLYHDVASAIHYHRVYDARGVELTLRFAIPRLRRFIVYYRALVESLR